MIFRQAWNPGVIPSTDLTDIMPRCRAPSVAVVRFRVSRARIKDRTMVRKSGTLTHQRRQHWTRVMRRSLEMPLSHRVSGHTCGPVMLAPSACSIKTSIFRSAHSRKCFARIASRHRTNWYCSESTQNLRRSKREGTHPCLHIKDKSCASRFAKYFMIMWWVIWSRPKPPARFNCFI